jgi:hypothetical protein
MIVVPCSCFHCFRGASAEQANATVSVIPLKLDFAGKKEVY